MIHRNQIYFLVSFYLYSIREHDESDTTTMSVRIIITSAFVSASLMSFPINIIMVVE